MRGSALSAFESKGQARIRVIRAALLRSARGFRAFRVPRFPRLPLTPARRVFPPGLDATGYEWVNDLYDGSDADCDVWYRGMYRADTDCTRDELKRFWKNRPRTEEAAAFR